MASKRTTTAAAAATLVVGAFALFLLFGGASEHTVLVVDNILETVAALAAGLVCALVAWRGSTGRRPGWFAMALALVGWGAGQAYWSWSEIIAEAETPFPSAADVGFLIFPLAAAVAVVSFQRGTSLGRARLRAVSDGLIVSSALFILSWAIVLGPVYAGGGDTSFAFVVALAYPIGDLVVMALVLLLLSRLAGNRGPMLILSAGLLAMVIADSGFAYLSTSGNYHTGSIIDLGWVAAFLLCAVAAVADTAGVHRTNEFAGVTRLALYLPILPFVAGGVVIAVKAWVSGFDHVLIGGGLLMLGLVALRQTLVLSENGQLVEVVNQREEELRHQAFHDPLTGLANRLLFRDRVEHAANLRPVNDDHELTVLFLDLDDFKLVNDRLGHAAGDNLLVDVAERLRACLRKGDTVARLGGDEFAVLLQDDFEGPDQLGRRVIDAMEVPFQLGHSRAQVTASVGVARLPVASDASAISDRLLQCADVAMYAAKRTHKGSYVVWDSSMFMDAPTLPHLALAHSDGHAEPVHAEPVHAEPLHP
jgi:diguanylate cyclase (GGDEF)-like protein